MNHKPFANKQFAMVQQFTSTPFGVIGVGLEEFLK